MINLVDQAANLSKNGRFAPAAPIPTDRSSIAHPQKASSRQCSARRGAAKF
jgi:hypothetical protein